MLPSAAELVVLLKRPIGVRAVLIQGANGGWGDVNGSSRGLSNSEDLRWLLANRVLADVVLVSFGTGTRENYHEWRPKGVLAELRAAAGLPPTVPLAVASADESRRAHAASFANLVVGMDDPITELKTAGYSNLVCEGGPRLVELLAAQSQLAEFALTTSSIAAHETIPTPNLDAWRKAAVENTRLDSDGFVYQLLSAHDRGDA